MTSRKCVTPILALLALFPSLVLAQTVPPASPVPPDARAPADPTFVFAKWKAKLYGFAEFDTMLDSTQSFAEIQGNGVIAKPGASYDNGRLQETIRNTRLGFALETPDFGGTRGMGLIEGDFFGFDPNPAYPAPASQPSEAGFFTNPTFRIRHAWVKIETPVVDVMGGQNWSLLGGSGLFQPASVALQGLNGEIYQRTPQLRVGKTFAAGGGSKIEIQAAALRPYQRDVAIPDLSAMVRAEFGGWTGYKSTGGTGGGLSNLQVAVSAVTKQFRVAPAKPVSTTDWVTASGSAVAVDAILPLIPATRASHAGALTLVGEASTGSGYNDSFTGLNAGIASAGAPAGAPASYGTTLDPGAAGWAGGAFTTVDYRSLLLNMQLYLSEAIFLSGIYSEMATGNAYAFPHGGNGTFVESKYASLALMWDATPATRIGFEGAWTRQHVSDASVRVNRRGLFSMWFSF